MMNPSFIDISNEPMRRKSVVFWDLEDCPIPEGVDPDLICENIEGALSRECNFGKVSIMAYGGKNNTIQEGGFTNGLYTFCYAGIRLVKEESGSIVDKMHKDILIWAIENPVKPGTEDHQVPNLVVIAKDVSNDSDFRRTLLLLNFENYNVIAALPNKVACSYARSVWPWKILFDGGKHIYQSGSATEK